MMRMPVTTRLLNTRPPRYAAVGTGVPRTRFRIPLSLAIVVPIARLVNVAVMTEKDTIDAM